MEEKYFLQIKEYNVLDEIKIRKRGNDRGKPIQRTNEEKGSGE